VMARFIAGYGLAEPIRAFAAAGKPVWGLCAGAIILSTEILSAPGRAAVPGPLGLLPARAIRNAYGRQLASFEAPLAVDGLGALGSEPLEAVFIRAPKLADLGEGVEVLARRDGDPVLVRQGNVVAATFHPELAADPRVHRLAFSSVLAAAPAAR